MNLCIDIGNSGVKAAIYSGSTLIGRTRWTKPGKREIEELKTGYPGISNVILCSVLDDDPGLINLLEKSFPSLLVLNHNTPLPITNSYKSKKTLGRDRLAAVAGANNNYPGKAVLVVDAGTAITYDIIDGTGCYLGGNISPGLSMRFRALHEFTGKLPLVKAADEVMMIADNTTGSIASGVINGIIFEMEAYILRMKEKYRDLIIIFTGGDANYFDKKLKNTIFADPDLIFTGLNRILTYNVEKN